MVKAAACLLTALVGLALIACAGGGAKPSPAVATPRLSQSNRTPTGPFDWQKAMLDDDARLPGQYIPPHPGKDGQVCSDRSCVATMDDREHIGVGLKIPICTEQQIQQKQVSDPLCYTSNPPTSGPHSPNPMPFRVLDNPAPKENLIHNMEHGGVIVWYNTDDQDVIKQLAAIVNERLDRRELLVMTRYPEMEPETIALTAWTRLNKFPVSQFDKKRVTDFISEHEKRFNPEGF